jgi:hypothetical protein
MMYSIQLITVELDLRDQTNSAFLSRVSALLDSVGVGVRS